MNDKELRDILLKQGWSQEGADFMVSKRHDPEMADMIAQVTGNSPLIEDEVLLEIKNGFTMLPNSVLSDSRVSMQARMTYALLLMHSWQDGKTWVGQETLSKEIGKNDTTVRKYLAELEGVGLIRIEKRGQGLTNMYYITDRKISEPQKLGLRTTKTTVQEPVKTVVNEDSVNKDSKTKTQGLNGKEKNAVRKSAEIDFKELTRLDHPARQSETNELWWTPLREICTLADWKPEVANWLIFESLQRLQKNGMTVSSPKSIIKTCRAIKAERDRGAFKQYNEPKGMTGLRSWLAQGA